MTGTEIGVRLPRQAIAGAITGALDKLDFTAVAEWVRPQGCICHRTGRTCTEPRPGYGDCEGYIIEVSLSASKAITADELIAALPEPCARELCTRVPILWIWTTDACPRSS